MICRHYYISGKVQGVFYRASTLEQAQQLGLAGWVRNLMDGRVEVVACGNEDVLQAFEAWLHIGPKMANVIAVEVTGLTQQPDCSGFELR